MSLLFPLIRKLKHQIRDPHEVSSNPKFIQSHQIHTQQLTKIQQTIQNSTKTKHQMPTSTPRDNNKHLTH